MITQSCCPGDNNGQIELFIDVIDNSFEPPTETALEDMPGETYIEWYNGNGYWLGTTFGDPDSPYYNTGLYDETFQLVGQGSGYTLSNLMASSNGEEYYCIVYYIDEGGDVTCQIANWADNPFVVYEPEPIEINVGPDNALEYHIATVNGQGIGCSFNVSCNGAEDGEITINENDITGGTLSLIHI